MSVITTGNWANGTKHTIIDNNPTTPSGAEVMKFFLMMNEEELLKALNLEVQTGTLSQEMAEKILEGYILKKPFFNAYTY